MKKITLFFIFATISVVSLAQSFTALYTFDSVKTTTGTTDPSFVPTVTGATFGSFMATGTPANSLAAARFDFADWALGSAGGVGDTLFSGMTGTLSSAEYYEVTITPTGGYSLNLDTIKFSFERSGTGVRTYCVRSSVDGFASNLTAVYIAPNINVDVQAGNIFFLKRDIISAQNRNVIVLGGAPFSMVSTPITFRFYAWNAEAISGTFSIDNVRFIGSATPPTGISEKTNSEITLYPNPSNGMFTANLGGVAKATITVYDIIGNVVYSKQAEGPKQTIDLSKEANGSYFVTIKTDKETTSKKIIINK